MRIKLRSEMSADCVEQLSPHPFSDIYTKLTGAHQSKKRALLSFCKNSHVGLKTIKYKLARGKTVAMVPNTAQYLDSNQCFSGISFSTENSLANLDCFICKGMRISTHITPDAIKSNPSGEPKSIAYVTIS